MDRNDIDVAYLSVSAPGVGMDTAAATARLARECNEGQTRIRADHPRRFGVFAALPLPDVDTTLREIAYAFDTLKVDGVGMMTNYDGVHIGDPRFWPVFDELNRRTAIVCVHPTMPFDFTGVPNVSASTLEFPFETTRAIISMLVHGTAARCPDTRMIWPHAGGAISALAGRANVLSVRHPKWLREALTSFWRPCAASATTWRNRRAPAPRPRWLPSPRPTSCYSARMCHFAGQPQVDVALAEMKALDSRNLDAINRDNARALFRSGP